METATLAGGCFWCLDAVFRQLKGVHEVVSGYAGGHVVNPTYKQVSTGATGHAETVNITFDPGAISFREILEVFFSIHDPTTIDRQGADIGPQYRSAVFYRSPEQKAEAKRMIKDLEAEKVFEAPVVTEVTSFTSFYRAEDYHQDYFSRNPDKSYCQIVISPKLAKFRKKFADKLKK